MAMRMPPQAAQTAAVPTINRSSLVFFGGLSLIVLNFYWNNPAALLGIFSTGKGGASGVSQTFQGVWDSLLQILGLIILTLMAEYGGDGAGSFALLFLAALWLLWLLAHFGQHPAATSGKSASPTSGGHGGNLK